MAFDLSRVYDRGRPGRAMVLSPDEERDILRTLGHGTMSGLAAVGNLLDLPGSSVRDVLAGENPLDQWTQSWFSPENRTTGRDLARQYGAAGNRDSWGNFLGGLGVEIAVDPLTYLTFGASALGKAGKLAKAAGVLPKTRVGRLTKNLRGLARDPDVLKHLEDAATKRGINLEDVLDQPLGGMFGTVFGGAYGSGKLSQKVAGRMDRIGKAVSESVPGRAVNALFDSSAGGLLRKSDQKLARQIYEAKHKFNPQMKLGFLRSVERVKQGQQAFRESFGGDLGQRLADQGIDVSDFDLEGHITDTYDRVLRIAAESPQRLPKALAVGADDARLQEIREVAESLRVTNAELYQSTLEMGGKGEWLEDFDSILDAALHAPRRAKRSTRIAKGEDWFTRKRMLDTTKGLGIKREAVIRRIPADVVNDVVTDSELRRRLAAGDRDAAVDHIMETYGEYMDTKWLPPPKTEGVLPGMEDALQQRHAELSRVQHAKDLAKYVKEHADKPIFTNKFLADNLDYIERGHHAKVTMQSVHQYVGAELDEFGGAVDGGILLPDVYKAANMDPDRSLQYLAKQRGIDPSALNSMRISEDAAVAISANMRIQHSPEWVEAIGGFLDSFLNLFKTSVTVPFPGFISRNLGSGQFVNASSGLLDIRDFAPRGGYTKRMRDAYRWFRSGGEGAEYLDEMWSQSLLGRTFDDVTLGDVATTPEEMMPTFKGVSEKALERIEESPLTGILQAGRMLPGIRQVVSAADRVPGVTRGARASRVMLNRWIEAGTRANQLAEWMNRVPMYATLRDKGFTPEAAAREVKKLHFDYADLAPFEKKVMRRATAFYTFSRKMAPLMVERLMERPGGLMGRTIMTSGRSGDRDSLQPEHIAQTLAIPWKTAPDGTKSYWTGLGLPHEDPLSFLSVAPGSGALGSLTPILANAGREAISRWNPLFKGPLEFFTGETFFQGGPGGGRALEDLDPTIGRTLTNIRDLWTGQKTREAEPFIDPLVEQVAANSPLTRFLTTGRMLTDPRKWEDPLSIATNMLLGPKISHVSPAAQDAVIRELAADFMKKELSGSEFTRNYISQAAIAEMPTEEQRELARQFNALMNTLTQRRRLRARR